MRKDKTEDEKTIHKLELEICDLNHRLNEQATNHDREQADLAALNKTLIEKLGTAQHKYQERDIAARRLQNDLDKLAESKDAEIKDLKNRVVVQSETIAAYQAASAEWGDRCTKLSDKIFRMEQQAKLMNETWVKEMHHKDKAIHDLNVKLAYAKEYQENAQDADVSEILRLKAKLYDLTEAKG